jgi:hypothetical protein
VPTSPPKPVVPDEPLPLDVQEQTTGGLSWQLFDISTQSPHVEDGHCMVRFSVISPVCSCTTPLESTRTGHETVFVSVFEPSHAQVFDFSTQSPHAWFTQS